MVLKEIVEDRFMKDVLRAVQPDESWKVLVLDTLAAKILSSCTRMTELVSEKVVLVENIEKSREVVPYEAIYLLYPDPETLRIFISDFERRPQYPAAHLFLLAACPDDLFDDIRNSAVYNFLKTFKEIYLSFLVYESLVYLLEYPKFFQLYFGPEKIEEVHLVRLADQLASLCFTLNEYPSIRYSSNFDACFELARLVSKRMETFKNENPELGEGFEKSRSTLIILDRSFDLRSPFLHELTYQAMAYDLLDIENDYYVYERNLLGQSQATFLDEQDDYWKELRHEHIASVTQNVTRKLSEFKRDRNIKTEKTTFKDLSLMIKKMPQYKKDLNKLSIHFHLASDCMEKYQRSIDLVCDAEQDLALGVDDNDEVVRDPLKKLIPVLLDSVIRPVDKIRLIILYTLHQNGISSDNLAKLLHHAHASEAERAVLHNLRFLGANVQTDMARRYVPFSYPRKLREKDRKYKLARWVPVIKDIMEDAIDGRLDKGIFPYVKERAPHDVSARAPTSLRYQTTRTDARRVMSRCIVFIVGGVCYSETRSAYEVTGRYNPKWEVIIGSDLVITPKKFMEHIQNLSQ
ncbi:STXBP1 [Cordylochernes scorpioides]|uniref:STXBP1 n=1 Tax=Cordylochernes scorpioides TaxID=51811 RepID=A0ABY6KJQ2_9ARAC|nr:STXBP1 [Cordylochernes scorpioides]